MKGEEGKNRTHARLQISMHFPAFYNPQEETLHYKTASIYKPHTYEWEHLTADLPQANKHLTLQTTCFRTFFARLVVPLPISHHWLVCSRLEWGLITGLLGVSNIIIHDSQTHLGTCLRACLFTFAFMGWEYQFSKAHRLHNVSSFSSFTRSKLNLGSCNYQQFSAGDVTWLHILFGKGFCFRLYYNGPEAQHHIITVPALVANRYE